LIDREVRTGWCREQLAAWFRSEQLERKRRRCDLGAREVEDVGGWDGLDGDINRPPRQPHALSTRSGRAPTFLARRIKKAETRGAGVVRERERETAWRSAWLLPRSAHLPGIAPRTRHVAGRRGGTWRCGSRCQEAKVSSPAGRSFLKGSKLEGASQAC
jgi:hypothetical protein